MGAKKNTAAHPETSSRHFKAILDSIADGVFTIDRDLNITYFNHAAEKITGVPGTQALGRKCFDVFRANICQSDCALSRTMQDGRQSIDLHINILNSDGHTIPASVSTSALRNNAGDIIGGVEIFRDLSAIETLRKEIQNRYCFEDIVSKSHAILSILDILPDIATSGSTVLIEGPSGSGKELFARAIHNLSGQKGRYVAINCAALPDTLLESELFGYRKGAFSEAKKDKPGRFERAAGGTLFLDEIGDISSALQVKLLRVIQEREYEPLGATAILKTDARVITATNRRLTELVSRGVFREDLFYRLNVVRLVLPPLTERREDIPLLVQRFIEKFNAIKSKNIDGIAREALDLLMRYSFPGNIRELENAIEFAFVLCHGTVITAHHLPREIQIAHRQGKAMKTDTASPPFAQAEKQALQEALQDHGGNRTRTAAFLGINKSTLWRKMKKHRLL